MIAKGVLMRPGARAPTSPPPLIRHWSRADTQGRRQKIFQRGGGQRK